MTQAQYAAHRSVSRQYISNLAKRGVLVMRSRLVDVQASDAVLDDKPETAAINQQPSSYAQARLAREVFSAKLKKLEYETKSGKLIPADDVTVKWYAIGRQIRDKLMGIPSKLMERIPPVMVLSAVLRARLC
jgi:phage terminase Nu1 subunit (DNA packaging protein)